MTPPPVDDPEALRRILNQAEALFLDFDGPICDLFAGLSASVVVDQLCVVLADGGYGDPPPEIEKSHDPFDVLRYAACLGKIEASYVNAAFTALEVEAIATAEPTEGAHELMQAWSRTNQKLAVVSNNSQKAIEVYLHRQQLSSFVAHLSARTTPDIALLKPSPHLLREALRWASAPANSTVFVGDSVTDIEAANAAGMLSVGYANKPDKYGLLAQMGPSCIVTDLSAIVSAIAK